MTNNCCCIYGMGKIHKEITQAKSFETRYSNMTQSQFAAAAA